MEVHPFLVIVLGILVHKTEASLGDSFPNYKTCVKECRTAVCDEDGYYYKDYVSLSFAIKLLWRCNDNCQYECMWDTVNTFLDKGWLPPQFHGKWPFARWFGIQEPASAIFSLANLSVHLKMFKQFLKEMRPSNPMYKIWVFYTLCSINGWFWSAVFHTRDLPFTELMDYLSAFGMVLCTSYTVGMRLLLKFHPLYSLVFSAMCLGYYFNHAAYLSVGMFDYRYNIIANLMAGVILIICSIIFILAHWRTHPQCRSLGIAIALLVCSVSLEMIDFSPVFWILDAHATWHLTTAPAVYYFWKFILEDSRGLQKEILRW